MWWWYIITLRKADLSVGTNASTSWNPDCRWVFRSLFGKFGPLNNLVPWAFPLKNGWGRVGTRLSAELCVIVIVFFLPYPVKFYFIYLVQSLARSHWPLWRKTFCTAAPLPSKEKWIGERGLSSFLCFCFVCLFVCFYQLFRERLSEKVHATIAKSIVGGFEFLVVSKKLERMAGEAMGIYLWLLMESNKSRFDNYSRQEECIDHIPYYLSGLSRALFPDNLSRNSWIPKP